ncbi:MAG: D-alanyl-D-alanine carboxypeptidase family protein, partial [Bacillota bacterium]|nr:D-alanyl-D-alanine carboxypeptidase family protein [Bacillota bacterium]
MMKLNLSAKRQERKECISIVVSNWQTISSRNKKKIIKLTSIIIAAALFLIGVTPSFAENPEDIKLKPSANVSWDDAPGIEGTSAILVDAGSGQILYEKNAYEKRDPASVTKIMTCLVVLETMELDDKITSTINFNDAGGSVGIDIKKGEVFTVEQLLHALMLFSANDAAEVLAISAGGSIENFCDMMNERAAMCGAKDTNFTNPHGLNVPEQPEHRTTAYDLTLIAQEAMKNKDFRRIISTIEYKIPKTNKSKAREMFNINRCISDGEYDENKYEDIALKGFYKYEGTLGIKTGYTSTAGDCFCGWVERDGTEFVSVVLNSSTHETRFADTIKLWDYGFEKYHTYTAASATDVIDEFRVRHGAKGKVAVSVADDFDITLNKDDKGKNITTEIVAKDKKIQAPIKKGQEVGTITAYNNSIAVAQKPLYAMEDVEKGGILSYIGIPNDRVFVFLLGVIAAIILLLVIV